MRQAKRPRQAEMFPIEAFSIRRRVCVSRVDVKGEGVRSRIEEPIVTRAPQHSPHAGSSADRLRSFASSKIAVFYGLRASSDLSAASANARFDRAARTFATARQAHDRLYRRISQKTARPSRIGARMSSLAEKRPAPARQHRIGDQGELRCQTRDGGEGANHTDCARHGQQLAHNITSQPSAKKFGVDDRSEASWSASRELKT
jgi:hypothetical protein